MTLVIKERPETGPGTSGWLVVVQETGEVILRTQHAIMRDPGGKSWSVICAWPGVKKTLRVADEAASVALAERIYALLLKRLNATPVPR